MTGLIYRLCCQKVQEELNKYSSAISGVPHFVVWALIDDDMYLSSFIWSMYTYFIHLLFTALPFRSMENINLVVASLQVYSWGRLRWWQKMELNCDLRNSKYVCVCWRDKNWSTEFNNKVGVQLIYSWLWNIWNYLYFHNFEVVIISGEHIWINFWGDRIWQRCQNVAKAESTLYSYLVGMGYAEDIRQKKNSLFLSAKFSFW